MEELFDDLEQIRCELEAQTEQNDYSATISFSESKADIKAEERARRISIRVSPRYDNAPPTMRLDYWTPKLYRTEEVGYCMYSPIRMLFQYVQNRPQRMSYAERRAALFRDQTVPFRLRHLAAKIETRFGEEALDRRLPSTLPKSCLLVDSKLKSGINDMSVAHIRCVYGGIAWKYLGRQAYKEYKRDVKPVLKSVAKSIFINDQRILVYLRLGYIQWLLDEDRLIEDTYLVKEEAGGDNEASVGYVQKAISSYRRIPRD